MQMKSSLKLGKVNVGRPTIKKKQKKKEKETPLQNSSSLQELEQDNGKLGKTR